MRRNMRSANYILGLLLLVSLGLSLAAGGYSEIKSRKDLTDEESDALFDSFIAYINDLAAREYKIAHTDEPPVGSQTVTSPPAASLAEKPRPVLNKGLRARHTALTRAKKRSGRRPVD